MATKGIDQKYCSECAAVINNRAEICPHCGVRQALAAPMTIVRSERNKTTAGLLAIFLGGIGFHHFYLGHIGLGIIYLIFCWTFIPAFIGLIEGIVFFSMTDVAFNQKYIK